MLQFALRNLFSRPLRSALALLGLTVAIMGMVGLFSVSAGLDQMVGATFGRIPGIVVMQPGAPIPLFSRLPLSWAREIESLPGVRTVRPELWARAQLVNGKMVFNPPRFLFGTDIERTLQMKEAVYRDDMIAGRFLTLEDRGTSHCVISQPIAEEYGRKVGDKLRVDGHILEIVGIYECKSLLLDVAIVLDQGALRGFIHAEPEMVSSVYVEPDSDQPVDAVMEVIRNHFRDRSLAAWKPSSANSLSQSLASPEALQAAIQGVISGWLKDADNPQSAGEEASEDRIASDPAEPALEVRSAQDWGERIQEFSADLDLFLWLMTGIGVVIALLSILNTMLMSVSERMIEFGVLKANGWSSGNVLVLILWESAVLGICGGLLGCLLGWIGTLILNAAFPNKLHLYASPGLLGFSLFFSAALGTFGGLYPAIWAVRMNPMDAIRRG